MKKLKQGFTLAEVLVCLIIIGIVIALALKVTQDSTQRAYNKYIRTGYENLYDVLQTTRRNNTDLASIRQNLANYFDPQRHFGSEVDSNIIRTNNGITYTVGSPYTDNDGTIDIYPISMEFPSARRNTGSRRHTCFSYIPRGNGRKFNTLVPLQDRVIAVDNPLNEFANTTCRFNDNNNYVDIQNNAALLPFTRNGNKESYRQAYCSVNGQLRVAKFERTLSSSSRKNPCVDDQGFAIENQVLCAHGDNPCDDPSFEKNNESVCGSHDDYWRFVDCEEGASIERKAYDERGRLQLY